MKLYLPLVALLLVLEGCGGARLKHQYHQAGLDLNSIGDGQIAVAVGDKRPYVLSADKPPTFTGRMRNNFGMTFNITTESGNTFAHDVATVVEAGYGGMKNGALLRTAAGNYDVFITVDQNLPF